MAKRQFEDYLNFRNMITPRIIEILFLVSVLICVVFGFYITLVKGSVPETVPQNYRVLGGIAIVLLGPIFARVYCEVLILFFRMNETMTELKNINNHMSKKIERLVRQRSEHQHFKKQKRNNV